MKVRKIRTEASQGGCQSSMPTRFHTHTTLNKFLGAEKKGMGKEKTGEELDSRILSMPKQYYTYSISVLSCSKIGHYRTKLNVGVV